MKSDWASGKAERLRALLFGVVSDVPFDGLLLSGGLDTSILAYVLSQVASDFQTIAVGLEGSETPDLKYASLIAKKLGIDNHRYIFGLDELKDSMENVVKIRETFDPIEIRNSSSIYVALKQASEMGIRKVVTGDGADEVFGGYSFLFPLEANERRERIREMSTNMEFSSVPISISLGIEVVLPYTDRRVIGFADDLDVDMFVRGREGRMVGKWILRKAFEGSLPKEIIWRRKTPIEEGSGTSILPEILDKEIGDRDFEERSAEVRRKDGVSLRSKEHLYCYELYREEFGPPKSMDPEKEICSYCGADVEPGRNFCRTCGSGHS